MRFQQSPRFHSGTNCKTRLIASCFPASPSLSPVTRTRSIAGSNRGLILGWVAPDATAAGMAILPLLAGVAIAHREKTGVIVTQFCSEKEVSLSYGRDFGHELGDSLAQTVWSSRNLLDLVVFRASGMSAPIRMSQPRIVRSEYRTHGNLSRTLEFDAAATNREGGLNWPCVARIAVRLRTLRECTAARRNLSCPPNKLSV